MTDYGTIGTGVAIAFIAFMQVWQKWQQAKTDKIVRDNAALALATAEKLEVVRMQGNSHLAEQLQLGMVSARALARSPDATPEIIALADVAEKKYRVHMLQQEKIEAAK